MSSGELGQNSPHTDYARDCTIEETFDSGAGEESFFSAPSLALGPTQPPIQWGIRV